ncbi:MAG: glycosyltransferase family 2 protein [Chlorobiaceae bacterium]|nr:glycosyltransferase family 2 protein [Chlorobiaceae bacterium]NTW73711.1 glycosyltransferase family 2 protein [Chlorobiaceae bacterium]
MKISVVIPLYNKRDTIERAIDSVCRQSYGAHEIVVVNDGSRDGSEKVVQAIARQGLRLIDQTNQGVAAARNKGIESAVCDWVAFLDGDDEWDPDFLRTIVRMHEAYPGHEVYATAYYAGDYLGEKRNIILNRIRFDGEQGILDNYFEVGACSAPPIWSSAVCISKEALRQIGGFPLGIRSGEDLLTWARLAVRKHPVYSIRPLATFWQDKAHTYDDKPNREPESGDPVGKAIAGLKQTPGALVNDIDSYLSMWYKMRASIFLRLGLRMRAIREILKGLLAQPSNSKLYIYLLLCATPSVLTRDIFKKFGRS